MKLWTETTYKTLANNLGKCIGRIREPLANANQGLLFDRYLLPPGAGVPSPLETALWLEISKKGQLCWGTWISRLSKCVERRPDDSPCVYGWPNKRYLD